MTKTKEFWLAVKRILRVGWFTTIFADKCDSHWNDRDCPNPPTWKEYHRGQFGHKVTFYFCDKCLAAHDSVEEYFKALGIKWSSDRNRTKI